MLNFHLPQYSEAQTDFISQVIYGFFSVHPLLGAMSGEATGHRGPIRNVRGSTPLDQTMPPVLGKASISHDAIRNSDIEAFAAFLHTLAQSQANSFGFQFFQSMSEVTEATGNTLDAAGVPFSFDMLNDMLEKIAIDFDDHGKPLLPALVISPEMYRKIRSVVPTPEQEQRMEAIIIRKREEFYAEKRTRRLSQQSP